MVSFYIIDFVLYKCTNMILGKIRTNRFILCLFICFSNQLLHVVILWMDVAIVIQKMVAAHFGTCNWMADSWLLLSRAKLELNWFICSKTAFVIYFAWILYYIPSFWPFDFGSDGLGEIYFIPFIKCSHYLHCYNSGGNYTDTLFFGSVCCTWNYLLSLL